VTRFVIRRLLQTVFVLIGVSFISFGALFITGDPALQMVGPDATAQQIQDLRHQMGFDRPWVIQYLDFMSKAVRGDFGVSIRNRQPAFDLVKERLPATLQLATAALGIALLVALPVGVFSATHRNTAYDSLAMLGALLGQSVPVFWLGLMLILVVGVYFRWLPVSGYGEVQNLVLPAVTLGTYSMARNARLIRSAMLEVLGLDFVRTAQAKGLTPVVIHIRHALRNALLPVITVVGLEFGLLLGSAVVVETIFAWPGVGRLLLNAIQGKDYPLVEAAVVTLAVVFVVLNLVVDLAYAYLDPRIRLS
jgi:ABC-type dipeptide/oligopeptide/nickel transport system permease component